MAEPPNPRIPTTMPTTTETLRALTSLFRAGRVLHVRDTSDCPITAGPVAVPGEAEPRWMICRYPSPGYGAGGLPCEEDDCGSAAAVARVLVRRYVGAAVAGRAVEMAGGMTGRSVSNGLLDSSKPLLGTKQPFA